MLLYICLLRCYFDLSQRVLSSVHIVSVIVMKSVPVLRVGRLELQIAPSHLHRGVILISPTEGEAGSDRNHCAQKSEVITTNRVNFAKGIPSYSLPGTSLSAPPHAQIRNR